MGGPKTCYNCNGEGHISRDCPEPKKMRSTFDDQGPYKRQRHDEGGMGIASFRKDDSSTWQNDMSQGHNQQNNIGWGVDS